MRLSQPEIRRDLTHSFEKSVSDGRTAVLISLRPIVVQHIRPGVCLEWKVVPQRRSRMTNFHRE